MIPFVLSVKQSQSVSYGLINASLFGVQLRMTTKLMYFMTAYYTPNDGFTANEQESGLAYIMTYKLLQSK